MNWGYKIITVYTLFVAGIVTMAVLSFKQPINLENENYYEAEKDQDDKMRQRTMGNAFRPLIKIEQNEESVDFVLPNEIVSKPSLQGVLKLTRPSDANLDKSFSFTAIENNALHIEKSTIKTGYWKYALEWQTAFGHYLVEDTLIVK